MIKRVMIYNITLLFVLLLLLVDADCFAESAVKYGATLSTWQDVRNNAFDRNSKSLRDENNLRTKLFLWGRWDLNQKVGAYLQLGNEAYYTVDSYNPDKHDFQWDELMIDNLYLDLKEINGLPLDIRIGRQPLFYGDGFLVADGTPSDKERSSYFNAVKATYRLAPEHSIDLVYLNDPKTDEFLPTIREGADTGANYLNHRRLLTPSDEQGVILYSRNRFDNGISLEPYYMYKREDSISASGKSASVPVLDLHTFGTRVVYDTSLWKLSGEFASQMGEYGNGRERTGYGANFSVRRKLQGAMWKPELELGYMYLSGDNTNTGTNEGWNPLFSRCNWWSKFYSSNYGLETGFSNYWTNLQLYRAATRLNFAEGTNLLLSYNYLRAGESTNVTGTSALYFDNNGKERGHLAQTKLDFKINKYIDGYLSYEYFFPGDFYKIKASQSLLAWRLNFNVGSDKTVKSVE